MDEALAEVLVDISAGPTGLLRRRGPGPGGRRGKAVWREFFKSVAFKAA